jgi:hypothetical protein
VFPGTYIVLRLANHVVKFLFRDKDKITHDEQEWLLGGIQALDTKLGLT